MGSTIRCFLDLDGVLSDFVGSACRLFGYSYADLVSSGIWPAGTGWDFYEFMGLTAADFWQEIERRSPAFWADLDKTAEADEIVRCVESHYGQENVCLLTSPSLDPAAATGKMQWVKRHYPRYLRQTLVGACKHFCAHRNALLIDDSDKNCEAFREAGGRAVLVPRHWNCRYNLESAIVPLLQVELPQQNRRD